MSEHELETVDERRRGDSAVLQAIGNLRNEVTARLSQQDGVLSQVRDLAEANATEVAAMKKVLPMKFFGALEGTATMGSLLGRAGGTITKIGGGCVVVWILFKFVILEAIKQTPK
jgi:hypothetical protein